MNSVSDLFKGEKVEGVEKDVVPHHQELSFGNLIEPCRHHIHYITKIPVIVKRDGITYFFPRG